VLAHGMPLIRVKPKHVARMGVERVGRVVGVRNGLPMLEDERVLEVENVIWCTGFRHGFDWIDLPVLGETEPLHERGVVAAEPALYFVGLMFLYAASSAQIHGVSRDAEPALYFVGLMFLYAASSAQIHGVSRDAERVANRIAAPAAPCHLAMLGTGERWTMPVCAPEGPAHRRSWSARAPDILGGEFELGRIPAISSHQRPGTLRSRHGQRGIGGVDV
jgi:hypothetical protein